MLEFPQNVTVDLNVELTNNILNSIHVNQYEHKSREINIYVKKDGIDYPIPNDLTVNIRIHKSNGYDIYKTIGKDIGAINGNIITILVDESMTIASGRQTCDIEFIDSNKNRLYSTKFYINVHKSALDDNNIKDNDDYSTVQSLARESKEYANLSKSYAVGTEDKVRENDSTDNAIYYKQQSEINANNALKSSEDANSYANEAFTSASNASRDAQQAAGSAIQASESAIISSNKASQATDSAAKAESFAHGGTGTRENEDIDNAKYYYEQAKSISESFSGTLRPMGTINFSLFVDTVMSTASEGDMYNILDEFTTNINFKEGSGRTIPAGANIYKTTDGMWDVLAGSPVTSVNGMRGNVSITPASIKALPDTTKYAGSDSVGGAANNLKYFKTTSNSNVGLDTTTENDIGYVSGTSAILGQNDGALYKQVYSSSWVHEIYGDYRTGQIAVRGKNNGTWQSWRKILDSGNYLNYTPFGKKISHTPSTITTAGWLRITSAIPYGTNFLLGINKGYNYNNTDSFWVSICTGYNSTPIITQLGCKSNGAAITKIRCVYNSETIYVEIYAAKNLSRESLNFNVIGINNLSISSSLTSTIESGYSTTELTLTSNTAITSNLTPTVNTATKATQDGNGNIITSTYLPLTGGTLTGRVTINNNWIATTGGSGWINDTYAGGIYMTDSTWVRTYNSKGFYTGSGTIRSDALLCTYGGNIIKYNGAGTYETYIGSLNNGGRVTTYNAGNGQAMHDLYVDSNGNGWFTTHHFNGYTGTILGTDNNGGFYIANCPSYGQARAMMMYDVNHLNCFFTYGLNSSGNPYIHCNTPWGAYGISMYASDTKLKKNIKPTQITNVLDKISKIEFIQFDWKNKEMGHTDFGISANQIEHLLPGSVYEVENPLVPKDKEKLIDDDNNETYKNIKNVNSDMLTTYCLKAIQELTTKVKDLEAKLSKYELVK